MVGCGLDISGDTETRNLRRLVAAVVDAEAKRQGIEPWGRTLWFYRGDEREETNSLPRSPHLP